MDDYYFESEHETAFDHEQRVEPGDERSDAIATARSWELPYLDDEPLVVDSESAARVGGEELSRIGAVPVRCGDGNVRVVLGDATPERIAGIREHFSGAVEIGVVKTSTLASLLDAATLAVVSDVSDHVGNGAAGATQIKIPSAQRKIGRLARIRNERERRLQITIKPIRPAPRSSTRIGLLHSRWDHAHSLEQSSRGSTL